MPSLLESLAGPEVPCAQCQNRVPGLRWGGLCPPCAEKLRGRAARAARRISLVATLLAALWSGLTLPKGPSSRIWIAVTAVAVFLLVRQIALRIAMEYYRSR